MSLDSFRKKILVVYLYKISAQWVDWLPRKLNFVFKKTFKSAIFLVACTRLYNPLCPSVGHNLHFRRLWAVFGLQRLPNCLAGLFHRCPCPPARDLGSCVSSLVFQFYVLQLHVHACTQVMALMAMIALKYNAWGSKSRVASRDDL